MFLRSLALASLLAAPLARGADVATLVEDVAAGVRAGGKPDDATSKLIRGEDISVRSDAENTQTAQLLQLVQDLAGQVEDLKAADLDMKGQVEELKAELLIQTERVTSTSTGLKADDIVADLDAEIARVAEEVIESHALRQKEPLQYDPSTATEGHPDTGSLKLSETSAPEGIASGHWCLLGHLYQYWYGRSHYLTAFNKDDDGAPINWDHGCDKCTSGSYHRHPDGNIVWLWGSEPSMSFWYICD